jgi:hypothetical protein
LWRFHFLLGATLKQHLSEDQILTYQERKITPEQLLEVDDHLQACESCRIRLNEKSVSVGTFESLRSGLRTIATMETDHISYEQLEGFIDRKFDGIEQEIIQSHLEICDVCKAEEQDLRSFQTELHQKIDDRKVIPFWRSRAFQIFYQVAGAAAVVFVVWIAATQFQNKKSNATLSNQNRKLQQKPAAGPLPLVVLSDGTSKIQLDRQGKLSGLPKLPSSVEQQIVVTLTDQRLETPPFLKELIGKREVLLGNSHDESNRFSLLSPVGTLVESDRPVFRWMPLRGADGYRLYIQDGNYNQVAVSPLIKETTWTASQALRRQTIYNWQVIAIKGVKEILSRVPPAPEAKFQILSESQLEELEKIRKASNNSHLVMGIVNAQYGLLDDAELEFNALSKENPELDVSRKLFLSVRSLRE